MAANLMAAGQASYTAADVRSIMGREGRELTGSAIAQALRHLANVGLIFQVGPGAYGPQTRTRIMAPCASVPRPDLAPQTFEAPSVDRLMAGRAIPSRSRSVDLECALWPEDRGK